MYARPPSHPAALGLDVSGCLALIPERHPTDKATPDLFPTLQPKSGAAPFTLAPNRALTDPKQQTQQPIVTGSSVVAVKFREGVILAADTLAAYGSTLRFKSTQRLHKVNENCLVGAGGEMSDYAHIREILEEITLDDFCADDGIQLTPSEIHALLSRVMYNRRSKFDPLWNSVVVGGLQDGKPFLGTVGMIGTHYVDDHVATGFGNHLMRPLLREHYQEGMTREEAVKLIKACLCVGCYRDARSVNKYQIALCTAAGVEVSEPFALELKWDYEKFVHPTKHAPNSW